MMMMMVMMGLMNVVVIFYMVVIIITTMMMMMLPVPLYNILHTIIATVLAILTIIGAKLTPMIM